MSHPLGSLADNLTAYAIYATAQAEMRHAYSLIDAGDYLAAAAAIDSAARAAEVLANVSASAATERTAHWRRVTSARRQFATRARAHAGQAARPQLVAA
ncbi:MAG: hypothetical protein GEV28_22040 [Actinophytocola sp.]|uniref:hypothetical protein n=1 Tax=Actinophytocola sp. TaxID=1872138 RepID=UPI00132C701C|nr:hypothetical protein [Actinophytocola sp.]MPZ82928.1 hypothetical protein [Actinophytocola sp.]